MSGTNFTPIELEQLAAGSVEGSGAFDVLMRATRDHLDVEWARGRIKGPEYATVYLGSVQQVLNTAMQFLLAKNTANMDAALKQKQMDLLDAQRLQVQAETLLTEQKTANAVLEGKVLAAQECKLKAEYDLTMLMKAKTTAETALLEQKNLTEKAQTQAMGVDENSILGRQKLLFKAQTDGFQRDAEQKAAKLMVDSWNARRMTDDQTKATDINQLTDPFIGRAVSKLLAGVNA